MENHRDRLQRRCPMLGGIISFGYCRKTDGDTPCWKIVDCWWETFDVAAWLKKHLGEAGFKKLLETRPKPKMTSLVELIMEAKDRVKTD